MDIIKCAMLGDKKAQQEITAKGELLPCPHCGKNAEIYIRDSNIERVFNKKRIPQYAKIICETTYSDGRKVYEYRTKMYIARCLDTLCSGRIQKSFKTKEEAISSWNTRPQLLTDEEMERLKKLEG